MTEELTTEISASLKSIHINEDSENISNFEAAEEVNSSDSASNYLKGSYR